jgi:hypothetical protein
LPREENLGVIGGILLIIDVASFHPSKLSARRVARQQTKAKKPAVWSVKSKFPVSQERQIEFVNVS